LKITLLELVPFKEFCGMHNLSVSSLILALIGAASIAPYGWAQAGGPARLAQGQNNQPAAANAGRGRASGPIAGPEHDPKDLSGVWNRRGPGGGGAFGGGSNPRLTSLGQDLLKQSKSTNNGQYTLTTTNDPVVSKCLPAGVPRIYLHPLPWQIVQTPQETIFIYEWDHTVRHIFTDGRKHDPDANPTYMGESIGSWDGDTFVVDTVAFNEKTWLDRNGTGHTDQLHVIERFHRVNLNDLELDVTMEDAKALAEPWKVHMQFQLHPEWNLLEYACTDSIDFVDFEK
jgi:hypothetical protein